MSTATTDRPRLDLTHADAFMAAIRRADLVEADRLAELNPDLREWLRRLVAYLEDRA